MSLTSLIKTRGDFRQALRATITPPPKPVFPDLRQAALTTSYGTVGTAFDYLLRMRLEREFGPDLTRSGAFVASLVPHMVDDAADAEQAQRSFDRADAVIRRYLRHACPFGPEVARACLVLARLEAVFRSGNPAYVHSAEDVNELDIQDLLGLADLIPLERFRPRERLVLNPGFEAGARVGGADADLLLDDLLIEIKTTRHPRLTSEYLHQLVGYLLLSRIGGGGIIGGEARPIRRLGVYFARHGLLHTFPVAGLFATGGLEDLQRWFEGMLDGDMAAQPDLSRYQARRSTAPGVPARPVVIVDYAEWLARSHEAETLSGPKP